MSFPRPGQALSTPAPRFLLDRIFLDANVLFSAAYLKNSRLGRLWRLEDAELLSSAFAVEQARRNLALDRRAALARLERLTLALKLLNPPRDLKLPAGVRLDFNDQPILLAAIHGKADFLLTGDGRHFGHLFGKRIEGAMVLRPAQYFQRRGRRRFPGRNHRLADHGQASDLVRG